VPPDLTRPTWSYKLRGWLAVLVLLVFVALYVGLTGWFGWTAYRLVRDALAGGPSAGWGFAAAVPAAFFTVFLAKGLLFVKRGSVGDMLEITPEEQPRLFAFLTRIAREAGAPRPHRVFVSSRVNASVFYDLSLLNLLVPVRKNLEIGLGLVNVLSVAELKAVLAHEFGHFAQRTMAVGRWVYISQQIAAAIIAKRDVLDRLLFFLSSVDIRIAWIGWLMRVVVWSIRAVLETAFQLVVVAERALSREMELNADLVSVALSGSDALVHALHKLSAADEAWESAVRFAAVQLDRGHAIADLFPIQLRYIDHVRHVLADERYGRTPALPEGERASHRVFEAAAGRPPKMWSTHPENREREDNAKRCYLPVPLDDGSAWKVFVDEPALRARVTAHLLEELQKGSELDKKPVAVPIDESLASVDEEFARPPLDRRYHGLYLGRSPVRHLAAVADAYGTLPKGDRIREALDRLYPATLTAEVERARRIEQEHAVLEALRDGLLTAPGGVIRHRGKALRRSELATVIAEVDAERKEASARLLEHDRACRTAHLAAARAIGQGWDEYLSGLLALLHYVSHAQANVEDAAAHLANVWAVVTADGRVSKREMRRLVAAGHEVFGALGEVDRHRRDVVLPESIRSTLEASLPQKLELDAPDLESIGPWLQVVDGWIAAFVIPLRELRITALDALLVAERRVESAHRDGTDPGRAPEPPAVPAKYTTLLPGGERPRQTKLDWWDRFQTADGLVPGAARLAVAAAIVGAVVAAGGTVGAPEVIVYNGLDRPVEVHIGDVTSTLKPFQRMALELPRARRVVVETRTRGGELIESFDADLDASFGRYVYNVAGAAALVEWTAAYGTASAAPPRTLGAVRWTSTSARHCFEQPPQSVQLRSGGATRLVLEAFATKPAEAFEVLETDASREALSLVHVRWDDLRSPRIGQWLYPFGVRAAGFADVLEARLEEAPREVLLLRLEQDAAQGDALDAVCARHTALADAAPNDTSLAYLRIRCMKDEEEKERAFLDANAKAPKDPWLGMAAGVIYAERAVWSEALPRLDRARALEPALAMLAELEARVRRAAAAEGNAAALGQLRQLGETWGPLGRKLALEKGDGVEGTARAYTDLAHGLLERALDRCRGHTECDRVDLLVAASEGSDPALGDRVLRRGASSLDGATVWSAVALAHHRGIDTTPYVDKARSLFPDVADTMLVFADAAALADTEAAEARLQGLDPFLRGQAYVMAIVVLEGRVPARWRSQAKALLFATERPYLR
jgi:Zn-dependent protease with chaperone function